MEKKSKFIISIDLGGTNLKIATVDEKLRIVDKDILPTPSAGGSTGSSGSRQLIEGIIRSVETQIEKKRLNYKNILGLGIGVPGPVDVKKGLVYFFPNIPGCKNLKLAQILKKRLALSVYIDNDANLFTLAEFLHIKGSGMQNILGITLGTGVGGGLIINGKLYRGQSLVAGEFGHIPIEINGRRCNCGGRGCIEAYVGNKAISARASQFKKRVSLEELSSLGKFGNQQAVKIWEEAGMHLGVALSGVVNLLNLDAVIIGGGIANAGNVLFEAIRKTIKERAMPTAGKHVKVFKGKLGENAALFGAAILVKSHYV